MRAWLGTRYSRLVSRLVPGVISRTSAAGRRTVHLTFDDGPTDETPALLEVLAEFDVRATFYLIGERARAHPELVRAIVADGHAIGNHSMTHVDAWKTPRGEVEREFEETTRVLEETSGRPVTTMRPPFGRLNRTVVRWARRHAQRLVLWDLMPPDFEEGASVARVSRVLRGVRPGSIVVLHDNEKSRGVTVPSLQATLPVLQDQGWEFSAPCSVIESVNRAA